MADTERLTREARYFHWTFFGCPPHDEIVSRYIQACGAVLPLPDRPLAARLDRIVDLRLDPEALEIALRGTPLGELLRQRIQVLFYLAEVRSEYLPLFVNQSSSRATAIGDIGLALLRTAVCWIKGSYLIRRHRLV